MNLFSSESLFLPHDVALRLSWEKETSWSRRWSLFRRIAYPSKSYLLERRRSRIEHIVQLLRRGFRHVRHVRMFEILSTPKQVLFFVELLGCTFLMELSLRFLPLHRLLARLSQGRPIAYDAEFAESGIKAIDWVLGMQASARKPTCLRRSLLQFWFFKKMQIPVTIHFGLRDATQEKGKAFPDGHAWLTVAGRIVSSEPLTDFAETYRY